MSTGGLEQGAGSPCTCMMKCSPNRTNSTDELIPGGGDDVVEVLPHVPRVDGAAPPREYARVPPIPIAAGGEGNVCYALQERSDFRTLFSE